MMSSSKLVETFPRPPQYYFEFVDGNSIRQPSLDDIDVSFLRDQLYSGLFSEKNLQFSMSNDSQLQLSTAQVRNRLLELLDMISINSGHIINLKTVENAHIVEMKSNLQAMLEEFHALLSNLRIREAKFDLIKQLEKKRNELKSVEDKMKL